MSGLSLSTHGKQNVKTLFRALKELSVYFSFLIIINEVSAQENGIQNITLQDTRSELNYLPALCNATETDTGCPGAWIEVEMAEASNGTVASTFGPAIEFENIIPQIYLTFRASAIFIKTSDVSNATANLTVSSQPSGNLESRVFAPSRDFWAIRDIDESQLTTAVVTYVPEVDDGLEIPSRLDIDFIKISVSNTSATESALPSQTIPTTAFTPIFATFSTIVSSSSALSTPRRQSPGAIVGETIGGMVGLFLICGLVATLLWRRYRRRRDEKKHKVEMTRLAAKQIMGVAS